ncbi:MAG: type II CAAX endopeptidase family protein [Bacteroidota bacterium]
MKNHFILTNQQLKIYFSTGLLLLLITGVVFPQSNKKPYSADQYLSILNNSKDSIYQQILDELDAHISRFPQDANVRISRCEVIEKAYYDYYEEYNPKEEEFEICLDQLMEDFPDHQAVLLFKLDRVYGETAIEFANEVIDKIKSSDENWDDRHISRFYAKLAQNYRYSDETRLSIKYALKAQELNDTLDLSVVLANSYLELKKNSEAESALLEKLDTTQDSWILKSKANLLLKAGNAKKALEIYDQVMKDTTVWINDEMLADIFLKNDLAEKARVFYLKNIESSYNKDNALQKLYQFDYEYSVADTVLSSYNKLMDQGVGQDLFGKYRLQMMMKKPLSGWGFSDLLKLLIVLLTIAVLFILPYLWILPLYYLSHKYFSKQKTLSLKDANWGLKEFWLVSSAILILQFIYLFIFGYTDLLGIFNDNIYSEETEVVSAQEASGTTFYFLAMAVIVTVFVIKEKRFYIETGSWSLGKCLGIGIGSAFALKIIHGILVKIGLFPTLDFSGEATIVDSIRSINEYYGPSLGFLLVVVLVPVYEEYLFRAIALTAMEKRVGYIFANISQSVMFALMHEDFSIFFFYVAFGMLAGSLVRRSESVLPGIIFHSTNNAMAFISILFLY